MKIQLILTLHITLLFCMSVNCIDNEYSETYIYNNLHRPQRFCGRNVRETMAVLCLQYNGFRSKRNISDQCCRRACTFYDLMKYYCAVPRFDLDQLPSWVTSSTQEVTTEKTSTTTKVRKSKSYQGEFKRWGKNGRKRKHKRCKCRCQGKASLQNKIHRHPTHRPADYGPVLSTRPPILYKGFSNVITGGHEGPRTAYHNHK